MEDTSPAFDIENEFIAMMKAINTGDAYETELTRLKQLQLTVMNEARVHLDAIKPYLISIVEGVTNDYMFVIVGKPSYVEYDVNTTPEQRVAIDNYIYNHKNRIAAQFSQFVSITWEDGKIIEMQPIPREHALEIVTDYTVDDITGDDELGFSFIQALQGVTFRITYLPQNMRLYYKAQERIVNHALHHVQKQMNPDITKVVRGMLDIAQPPGPSGMKSVRYNHGGLKRKKARQYTKKR